MKTRSIKTARSATVQTARITREDVRAALGLKESEPLPLFVDEKLLSQLTGRSVSWFQRKRWEGGGPSFQKCEGGRAVRYPLMRALAWFDDPVLERESTSEG